MKTEVKIAQFKAKLSRYLRAAQRGSEFVIKDRDTPIARLGPCRPSRPRLAVIEPTRPLKDLDKLPRFAPPGLTWEDIERALKEERRERMDDIIEGLR